MSEVQFSRHLPESATRTLGLRIKVRFLWESAAGLLDDQVRRVMTTFDAGSLTLTMDELSQVT